MKASKTSVGGGVNGDRADDGGAHEAILIPPIYSRPMLDTLRAKLSESVRLAARQKLGVEIERVVLERPPTLALGDLACPVAFDLARPLRKAPRAIAAELAQAVALPAGVREARVEGAGYLNFFLDRGPVVRALLAGPAAAPAAAGKIIVEHTNINPNKAAHIGHLRNAVLGDVLVRALRHLGPLGRGPELSRRHGRPGRRRRGRSRAPPGRRRPSRPRGGSSTSAASPAGPSSPRASPTSAGTSTPRSGAPMRRDPRRRPGGTRSSTRSRRATTRPPRIAAVVSEAVSQAHLATMGRIGIAYDLLPRESDILHKHFWAKAFELLKSAGAIHLETEGKHAGCWVLRLTESDEFAGMEEPDKILVRSNGTVTYTGKDIAYQLWKFGLLPIDFDYERLRARLELGRGRGGGDPGRRSGRTRSGGRRTPAAPPARPRSGTATRVYNVIDVRQSYPQKVVREGLRDARPRPRGRRLDPFLLRDRGALAEGRARARRAVRRGVPPLGRGREEALRRDVRAQGPRRQGRRPRRAAPRALAGRGGLAARRGAAAPPRPTPTPGRSPSGRSGTSC